jgi:hypothetical protein
MNLTSLRQHLQYNFDPGKLVLYSVSAAPISQNKLLTINQVYYLGLFLKTRKRYNYLQR